MTSYSVKLHINKQRVSDNGLAALSLQVIINRELKFLPLNLKWPIAFFDKKGGRLLPRQKQDAEMQDFNLIINNEILKINEIFKIYRIQDKPLDLDGFLYEMQHFNARKDFLEFMKVQIEQRYKYKQIDLRTYKNSKCTLNRLKQFKPSIPFYMLTDKLLAQFAGWLRTKKQNAEGTVWTRLKDFTAYIKLAENEDIPVPASYRRFKNISSKPSIIYLESEEIDALVSLYNSKRLLEPQQQVLAAFLFSCFTGLRISDIQRVNHSWLTVGKTLRFLPHKGRKFRKEINVPVGAIAKGFIQNDKGLFFTLPTDQEVNRTLKDLAKAANVKTPISFHVSRHTFGTHYYRQTKDVISLQKILGHAKIETTMVYVHINEQDKLKGIETMNDHFEKNAIYLRVVS